MNRICKSRSFRWGVIALAAVFLLQSTLITIPNLHAMTDSATTTVSTEPASMPCDDGGDCCLDDASAPMSCRDIDNCAGGDCALRVLASVPMTALPDLATPMHSQQLPADAPLWLLTRHDTPLLRPPISV